MSKRLVAWFVLGLSVFGAGACSSASSREEPTEAPNIQKSVSCDHTYCSEMLDSCHHSCVTSCNGSMYPNVCAADCAGIPCGTCEVSQYQCAANAYSFTIVGPADPQLLQACENAVQRDQACGETVVDPNCDRAARIEKTSNVDVYACIAALPCASDPSSCYPAPSHDAEHFCERLSAACSSDYECPSDTVASLDAMFGWYKASTVASALACLHESRCNDKIGCFNAWVQAMTSSSSG